jgi:ribosomal protein S15P/S13E
MEQTDQLQLTTLPEAGIQQIADFLSHKDFLSLFLACRTIKNNLAIQLVQRKKYYDFPTHNAWTFDINKLEFDPFNDKDEVFKEKADKYIAEHAKDNFGVTISFAYASLDATDGGREGKTSDFLAFLIARFAQLNNHIIEINLDHNCFRNLPKELFQLPRLQDLVLSRNPLIYKPHMFKGLPAGINLSLDDNDQDWPQEPISLFEGNKLGIVSLANNGIKHLSYELFKDASSVYCIEVEKNPLNSIDTRIETLPGLSHICVPRKYHCKDKFLLLTPKKLADGSLSLRRNSKQP